MLAMFKYMPFRFFLSLGITPFCVILISGCNTRDLDINQSVNSKEVIDKIESVAALGQLVPLGEVRKLAAPNSGKGGTPRLSKLLIEEGDSIVKGQILAVFDNRPKLEASLKSAQANLNILMSEISIKKKGN